MNIETVCPTCGGYAVQSALRRRVCLNGHRWTAQTSMPIPAMKGHRRQPPPPDPEPPFGLRRAAAAEQRTLPDLMR